MVKQKKNSKTRSGPIRPETAHKTLQQSLGCLTFISDILYNFKGVPASAKELYFVCRWFRSSSLFSLKVQRVNYFSAALSLSAYFTITVFDLLYCPFTCSDEAICQEINQQF